MNESQNQFSNVSLLITHYNRSNSLERLLYTFKQQDVHFKEIVVSDDCSNSFHQEHIKQLQQTYKFTFLPSDVNGGLGSNLNKGQKLINTPYTLYVQEDFIPTENFIPNFKNALEIMDSEPKFDIIRFYAYSSYPYLKPYKFGFSEMVYKPWFLKKDKIYNYSDHPHLRRNTFFEKFGTYTEGIKSDKTEYQMCLSFIQNGGRGLFYDKYESLFIQENSLTEPSTVIRSNWRQSDNYLVSFVRVIYRLFKYNYDLHLDTRFKKKA